MKHVVLAAIAATLLSGCLAWLPRVQSNVYNYSGETYAARHEGKPIPILDQEAPARPYIRIARIETSSLFGTNEEAFEELRRRAMALGADAVIEFQRTSRKYETDSLSVNGTDETTYKRKGEVTEQSKTVTRLRSEGETISFSGIAIRYKD